MPLCPSTSINPLPPGKFCFPTISFLPRSVSWYPPSRFSFLPCLSQPTLSHSMVGILVNILYTSTTQLTVRADKNPFLYTARNRFSLFSTVLWSPPFGFQFSTVPFLSIFTSKCRQANSCFLLCRKQSSSCYIITNVSWLHICKLVLDSPPTTSPTEAPEPKRKLCCCIAFFPSCRNNFLSSLPPPAHP